MPSTRIPAPLASVRHHLELASLIHHRPIHIVEELPVVGFVDQHCAFVEGNPDHLCRDERGELLASRVGECWDSVRFRLMTIHPAGKGRSSLFEEIVASVCSELDGGPGAA